ncbi:5644_t:CDS:2 [Paraglomus occultum]|uniref:5644_t:CDS:1 n=1 Tax=Paraglomus occultum TaxID=144539 RepID=A0A9N8YXV7_9GLOM|nr:5644_t:CDS:2 [Paraglomus occultum]
MGQTISAINEELSRISEIPTTSPPHYQHEQQTFQKRESPSSLPYSQLVSRSLAAKKEQDYSSYQTQNIAKGNENVTDNSFPPTIRPYIIVRSGTTTSLTGKYTITQSKRKFVHNELETLLEHPSNKVLHARLSEECNVCEESIVVTSFRLYAATLDSDQEEPTIEILRNLEWNDHYRVFGFWKCQICKKKWRSAYTWISLREFMMQTTARNLKDYYMQRCKTCNGNAKCSGQKRNDSDTSFIYDYQPLKLSRSTDPHKDELCAKCQSGQSNKCRYSTHSTYTGKKR